MHTNQRLLENVSLRPYNTMGIDAKARYFTSFTSVNDLREVLEESRSINRKLLIGGGSNLLLTKDFDGLVLKNDITGTEIVKEDMRHVYLRAGAGENWHRFVENCLGRNLAGVENLSLIPGSVGASPMQNIGAYGVELKEVFEELQALRTEDGKLYTFTANDCEFGYRESVFKGKYRNQFVIVNVTFRLNKQSNFNISYGALEQELDNMGVKQLSIRAISQAVINIRSSKLPDPKQVGNAGSFFKNPSVLSTSFEDLKKKFPTILGYPNKDGSIKLSAGWLIEHCGPPETASWKGFRRGDAGCYDKQALVLVNYGSASGQEIYDLSEEILQSVKKKFGVELEREVNIVN